MWVSGLVHNPFEGSSYSSPDCFCFLGDFNTIVVKCRAHGVMESILLYVVYLNVIKMFCFHRIVKIIS